MDQCQHLPLKEYGALCQQKEVTEGKLLPHPIEMERCVTSQVL